MRNIGNQFFLHTVGSLQILCCEIQRVGKLLYLPIALAGKFYIILSRRQLFRGTIHLGNRL